MPRLRIVVLFFFVVGLLWGAAGTAWADSYAGPAGHTPQAGPNSGDTQVLAQTFTRTSNGGFLASTGADIAGGALVGVACVGLGVFFVRRSHASEKPPPAAAA